MTTASLHMDGLVDGSSFTLNSDSKATASSIREALSSQFLIEPSAIQLYSVQALNSDAEIDRAVASSSALAFRIPGGCSIASIEELTAHNQELHQNVDRLTEALLAMADELDRLQALNTSNPQSATQASSAQVASSVIVPGLPPTGPASASPRPSSATRPTSAGGSGGSNFASPRVRRAMNNAAAAAAGGASLPAPSPPPRVDPLTTSSPSAPVATAPASVVTSTPAPTESSAGGSAASSAPVIPKMKIPVIAESSTASNTAPAGVPKLRLGGNTSASSSAPSAPSAPKVPSLSTAGLSSSESSGDQAPRNAPPRLPLGSALNRDESNSASAPAPAATVSAASTVPTVPAGGNEKEKPTSTWSSVAARPSSSPRTVGTSPRLVTTSPRVVAAVVPPLQTTPTKTTKESADSNSKPRRSSGAAAVPSLGKLPSANASSTSTTPQRSSLAAAGSFSLSLNLPRSESSDSS